MAALDFKDRSAVLALLVGLFPGVNVGVVEALLDASAGSDCGDPPVKTYRPFFVQANLQQQVIDGLQSATGASGASVTYRDNAKAIRSLMQQQAALDKSLCSIPEGFEATGGGVIRMETVF